LELSVRGDTSEDRRIQGAVINRWRVAVVARWGDEAALDRGWHAGEARDAMLEVKGG
jgi:hypothetical protein